MNWSTPQEAFWAQDFGSTYIDRNQGESWVASATAFFTPILRHLGHPSSVLELGPNIGLNLMALKNLLPKTELYGLEINPEACGVLQKSGVCKEVINGSLLAPPAHTPLCDLVFTKGVLIHIAPSHLEQAYKTLYEKSRKFICVAEYYNPSPVSIEYRGHSDRLFKRDFAGELMDKYPLRLVDYGFTYHRDPLFPQDDLNWFLLEKEG